MTGNPNRRILLGLTGGIAAYKAAELARLFVKSGADLRVVMTEAACRFVTPATMQALSGKPVYTDLWDARVSDGMGHIELSRDRELILVAPASADFIAKLAAGLADDLLSTLCLARRCPLAVAPAMNVEMWSCPPTQRNVQRVREDGVWVLGPGSGEQACGETGWGRMLEPRELFDAASAMLGPALLAGRRVLVTAGPTFEPLDTVRGITNLSSGKMGYAVAQAAAEAGAEVTLVSGRTSLPAPAGTSRVDVLTAAQMHREVMARVGATDVFIAVAAVADYHVVGAKSHKIKRGSGNLTIELAPNPDILAEVAALAKPPFCVGFAAETENLREYATQKRRRKGIPLLAANLAQETFGRDDNALTLFDDSGEHRLERAPKIVLARRLIEHVAGMLAGR
ncbi:MAG: bifunctional phosphopantothenoylcysteine decarboxylase/phosphopantothenate--cysteine ligase CoaBC [Burkholderiales bacterium]|nr:bifunctional phosphopantothenoylcysteine decarboxylase/phosphopantothenate--cysteine ligase CoaBC [Burkholderiales bacterium]